jgi:arsenate reductase (thioredoxin)
VHLSLIRIVAISTFVLTLGSPVSKGHAQTHDSQVLFVCEHGNVKSLMAVSYFNQLAQERRLPFRAVSRGTAPDSTTVPPTIIQGLRGDGFDVSSFHPSAVRVSDISASQRVITIGTALPTDAQAAAQPKIEQWNALWLTRTSSSYAPQILDQLWLGSHNLRSLMPTLLATEPQS